MNPATICIVCCQLGFGALNTLTTKVLFQLKSYDLDGNFVSFQKPWFGVFRMFFGMSFVILFHFYFELKNRAARKRQHAGAYVSLDGQTPEATPLKAYLLVALPTFLDLFGTVASYVGLFYIAPSTWQMFRGSMLLFATLFSVTVLKKRMNRVRWLGIGICLLAITIVGFANAMTAQPQTDHVDPSLKLFGMCMVLLGMSMQGAQVVAEEWLMTGVNCPPLMVVGMEGVWGCIYCLTLVFPATWMLPGDDVGGCQESLSNDLAMVRNSGTLQAAIVVYLGSVLTYNTAGMLVTYSLSAVHNTMIEASRTAIIWGMDLTIHHLLPSSAYGEVWNSWSFLQLVGFATLVVGQATYSELITWGMEVAPDVAPPMSPVREPGSPFLRPAAGEGPLSPLSP